MSVEELIREFVRDGTSVDTRKALYSKVLSCVGYRLPLDQVNCNNIEQRKELLKRVRREWRNFMIPFRAMKVDQEEKMRCRSSRSSMGYYEYIDLESGHLIEPEDYQSRYEAFLLKEQQSSMSKSSSNHLHFQFMNDSINENIVECSSYGALELLITAAAMVSAALSHNDTSLTIGNDRGKRKIIQLDEVEDETENLFLDKRNSKILSKRSKLESTNCMSGIAMIAP